VAVVAAADGGTEADDDSVEVTSGRDHAADASTARVEVEITDAAYETVLSGSRVIPNNILLICLFGAQ